MTGMRPLATACTLLVLQGAAAFGYAKFVGTPQPSAYSAKQSPVSISGSVENLQPGMPTVMVAKARNNTSKRLVIKRFRLKVKDASPLCPRTMLQAKPLRRRNALPPGRTRTVPVEVVLDSAAPDACQQARFPIKFQARATAKR